VDADAGEVGVDLPDDRPGTSKEADSLDDLAPSVPRLDDFHGQDGRAFEIELGPRRRVLLVGGDDGGVAAEQRVGIAAEEEAGAEAVDGRPRSRAGFFPARQHGADLRQHPPVRRGVEASGTLAELAFDQLPIGLLVEEGDELIDGHRPGIAHARRPIETYLVSR